LKSRQYQPKKAEKEVETDMPGMTDDQLKDAFFCPFKFEKENWPGVNVRYLCPIILVK